MSVSAVNADKGTAGQEAFGYLEQQPPFDPSLIAQPVQYEEVDAPAADEQPDPAEELERYKARVAQLESETVAERQAREQLEQAQEERQAREAQARFQQWQGSETQAVEHAKTLAHGDAITYMRSFYAQREQALLGWGQETANEAQVLKWQREAEKVARAEGLADGDVEALVTAARTAGSAKAIKAEAGRIKASKEASNREIRELREKLERMEAEQNRSRLANSPVARVGQGGSRSAPANVQAGSIDHLNMLLGDMPR